jgi:hypothetical protein
MLWTAYTELKWKPVYKCDSMCVFYEDLRKVPNNIFCKRGVHKKISRSLKLFTLISRRNLKNIMGSIL